MANYIVSYDLNGTVPTHAEMDQHMEDAGWARARILETVWYVGTKQNRKEVYDHINSILSKNDQIIVVRARGGVFRNLLIKNKRFESLWIANT